MADEFEAVTWDGKPIAPEPPFGATVVVYRSDGHHYRFLLLHRVHAAEPDGDWAWTPPSGARYPGEELAHCARRELAEETGLALELTAIDRGTLEWAVYAAALLSNTAVQLSVEHDHYRWVDLAEALRLCKPEGVATAISDVARALGLC